MKKIISGHTLLNTHVLYGLAAVLCIGCMILVWPIGIIRTEVESHNGADGRIGVGPLSGGSYTEQYFVPQFTYLKEMAIAFSYEEIQDENAVV
ncbi:MAG: hypothetical protein LUG56_09885, partial [Lachnospiraceae bacterium]|nr:hypothetical protein [Lachnospiraceae bacterium]